MRQVVILNLRDVQGFATSRQLLVAVRRVPGYSIEGREVLEEVVVVLNIFGVEAGEECRVEGLEGLAFA